MWSHFFISYFPVGMKLLEKALAWKNAAAGGGFPGFVPSSSSNNDIDDEVRQDDSVLGKRNYDDAEIDIE